MSHDEKFIERAKKGIVKIKAIQFKTITEEYMGYFVICNDFQCAYFAKGHFAVINNRDFLMVI